MVKQTNLPLEKKQELIQQVHNISINGLGFNSDLENILKQCPEYDLSNMVRKDVASNICYGCDIN